MPTTQHHEQGKDLLGQIHRMARERFGFEQLRPGQAETIVSVLQRQDTLAVMAAGSGKSAIYQIAGLLTNGPAVMISPLIALQKDQSESIQEQETAPAAVVNSSVRSSDVRQAFLDLAAGVRPNNSTVSASGTTLSAGISTARDGGGKLGHPIILALTATATHAVRDEIIARLGMRNPAVIVRGWIDQTSGWA